MEEERDAAETISMTGRVRLTEDVLGGKSKDEPAHEQQRMIE